MKEEIVMYMWRIEAGVLTAVQSKESGDIFNKNDSDDSKVLIDKLEREKKLSEEKVKTLEEFIYKHKLVNDDKHKTKYCPKCKKDLSIEKFSKDKNSKNGFTSYCKECSKLASKEYYYRKKSKQNTKVCTKCGEKKLLEEFDRDKNGKYGHKSKCKVCTSLYKKEYNNRKEQEKNSNINNLAKKIQGDREISDGSIPLTSSGDVDRKTKTEKNWGMFNLRKKKQ